MQRREWVWLSVLVLFAGGLLIAGWWFNRQADQIAKVNTVLNGRVEDAAEVLLAGFDPNSRTLEGTTVLYQATMNCDLALIRKLLEHGADASLTNQWNGVDTGETALHAAAYNCFEAIPEILKHSPNINAADFRGNTPLHWAAKTRRILPIQLLTDHGANTRIRNDDGALPADVYFSPRPPYSGTSEIIRLLGPPTQLIEYLVRNLP